MRCPTPPAGHCRDAHRVAGQCLHLALLGLVAGALLAHAAAAAAASPDYGVAGSPDPRPVSPASITGAAGTWRLIEFMSYRSGHTAVIDDEYDRMLVFGGATSTDPSLGPSNGVWSLNLDGDSLWTRLPATGTEPPAMSEHTAVLDPVRDRMVVLGTNSAVWTLTVRGTPTWTNLVPAGTPPPARDKAAAGYDPVGDQIVLYGGTSGGGGLGDVWLLRLGGTPQWTAISPTGQQPSPRYGHSVVYDPVRRRMLVFGGVACTPGCAEANDVWALSLDGSPAWTRITPSGTPPVARREHTAVYDPVGDRMLVHGGFPASSSIPRSDLWALSLSGSPAWSQVSTSGSVMAARHTMAYDALRRSLVLFGGDSGTGLGIPVRRLPLTPPLVWDSGDLFWPLPSPRQKHAAVFDPARDRMVAFGGSGNVSVGTHTPTFCPGPRWIDTGYITGPGVFPTAAVPTTRYDHTMVHDAAGDRAIMFGGVDPSELPKNDVWQYAYATETWTQLTPAGTPPAARSRHTSVLDPTGRRMLVWGGYEAGVGFSVWALSLSGTPTWSELTAPDRPIPRWDHTAVFDPARNRMVVFGGFQDASPPLPTSVWQFTPGGTPAWQQVATSGTPPPGGQGYSACYDSRRDRMLVFGAPAGNNVWELAFGAGHTWTQLSPSGSRPVPRVEHTAVYDPDNDRMLVFGGFDDLSPYRNDVWALEFTDPVGVPDPPPVARPGLELLYPNPALHEAVGVFRLASAGPVRVAVYGVDGRLVQELHDGPLPAGRHRVTWDLQSSSGARAAPGIYLLVVTSTEGRWSGRVVLLR